MRKLTAPVVHAPAGSMHAMSLAWRDRMGEEHTRLNRELIESGDCVGRIGLAEKVQSKVVRIRGGATIVTDGGSATSKAWAAGLGG